MTEVLMNKMHLIGVGYAEMPHDGRRYRFCIERYRNDDGSEWGRVVSTEEVPEKGPYIWIPSWGTRGHDEAEHLFQEAQHEQEHPHPLDAEYLAQHREKQSRKMQRYDELREKRADLVKKNPRTLGGRR